MTHRKDFDIHLFYCNCNFICPVPTCKGKRNLNKKRVIRDNNYNLQVLNLSQSKQSAKMEIMELNLKPTYFSLPIFFSTSEGAFYNIVHIVVCLLLLIQYLLTKSHSIYCKQYEIAPCSYLTDAIAILLCYYFQCSTQLIVPSLLKHKY